jgi:hypothetical protein
VRHLKSGIGEQFPARSQFGPIASLIGAGEFPAVSPEAASLPHKPLVGGSGGATFPCWQGIRLR